MASVAPPKPTYRPSPDRPGHLALALLSDAQLESNSYAGEAASRPVFRRIVSVDETFDTVSAAPNERRERRAFQARLDAGRRHWRREGAARSPAFFWTTG